ncbi:hypothetical protein Cgig2_032402 [Carnegiea gigantea]|uniref:Uncharacterized protein n=1 Tax=Carnegiea gigantea TaxID=171969 RepID=A0A9Q1GNE4_9CARY|nr:hypothetical protein Cgig2_032402 [Carnegiea gigantea]
MDVIASDWSIFANKMKCSRHTTLTQCSRHANRGWTDDTYLLALPPGRAAVKLNIKLTTLNELNGVIYKVTNSSTAKPRGFHLTGTTGHILGRTHLHMELQRSGESFLPTKPIHYDIYHGGICGGPHRHTSWQLERTKLLNEVHELQYYFREALSFVGGVAILWNNSKIEVSGFAGHDMDMSCIFKLTTVATV